MSKLASQLRKQRYNSLMNEFRQNDDNLRLSNVKIFLGVKQFCLYLANYTDIEHIKEIDYDTIRCFLIYTLKSQKTVMMSLSDIKRTIQAIQELTDNPLWHLDFSLSNTDLWSNLH